MLTAHCAQGNIFFKKTGRKNNMRQGLLILVIALSLRAVGYSDFKICTSGGIQRNPTIYGDIVVWEDARGTGYRTKGMNLKTGHEFMIGSSSNDLQMYHYLYKKILVWQDYRNDNYDIYGMDMSNGQEIVICISNGNQQLPVIYDNIVVWEDGRNGHGDIYGYDLLTGQEFPICTESGSQSSPSIYGNIVLWHDYRNGEKSDIYGVDLNLMEQFAICTADGNQGNPEIFGNVVVWEDDRDGDWNIYGKNLSNDQEFSVCTAIGNQSMPVIYENIVVWIDERNGSSNMDIYGYDLNSGSEFALSTEYEHQRSPAIYKDIVVWRDGRNGNSDIYGYDLKVAGEPTYPVEIQLGQVIQGSSANHTGSDMTVLGYNDNVDVWYYFTPAETGHYTVSLCGSGFDTTLAVFDENMVEVAYNEDFCGEQSKLVLKGKAGKKYYIRIAGYDGASGDYVLSVIKDGPEPLQSDINFDGKVNLTDFRIMANEWLKP